MPVLIGMRCLQAIGSSAVISVGAGSLADMYEVHERGQKVGLHSFSCFLPLLPWSFHSSYFSFLPLVSKDKTAKSQARPLLWDAAPWSGSRSIDRWCTW
jgi:MFS family permease